MEINDNLPLPKGAPEFIEYRHAYSRAKWQGPGKGYVDVTKEREGALLGMQAGLTTLEEQCAELDGSDWREVLGNRHLEIKRMLELDIPLPEWVNKAPPATGGDERQP